MPTGAPTPSAPTVSRGRSRRKAARPPDGPGGSARTRACRSPSASRRRPIATRVSPRAPASAACAASRCTASAGIATFGTPDRTGGRRGTPPAWWRGGSGMRRATTTRCCGACRRDAARRPAGGCGRPRRSTTGCRCFASGASGATRHGRSCLSYWGLPNLQVINRDVHAAKCADEAKARSRSRKTIAAEGVPTARCLRRQHPQRVQ